MAARLLLWLTLSVAALWLMLAFPATTCPPVGNWVGNGGAAMAPLEAMTETISVRLLRPTRSALKGSQPRASCRW